MVIESLCVKRNKGTLLRKIIRSSYLITIKISNKSIIIVSANNGAFKLRNIFNAKRCPKIYGECLVKYSPIIIISIANPAFPLMPAAIIKALILIMDYQKFMSMIINLLEDMD